MDLVRISGLLTALKSPKILNFEYLNLHSYHNLIILRYIRDQIGDCFKPKGFSSVQSNILLIPFPISELILCDTFE